MLLVRVNVVYSENFGKLEVGKKPIRKDGNIIVMGNNRFKLVLFFYTLTLTYWMILGFDRSTSYNFRYNLKPFYTIKKFSKNYDLYIWMINIIGNIAVFIPFGILLPIVFGGKIKRSLIIFLSGLFILESLQLLTKRGTFDIDDFILNTLGFLIGYLILKILRKLYFHGH